MGLFLKRLWNKFYLRSISSFAPAGAGCYGGQAGFNAWLGEEISPTDEGFRLFLSRYIDRCPVTNSGLTLDGDHIKYTIKEQFQLFTPLDFLARLATHIANHYESVVRRYGWYSYRTSGEQKNKILQNQPELDQPIPFASNPNIDKKKASKTWAALIKRVFEVDPLICRKCGGLMKIKAFITNPHEVKRLLENLSIQPFIKPLPLHGTAPPSSGSIPSLSKAA